MAYKPLEKAEIEEGLRAEVLEMPEPLQRFYESVAVPVHESAYADSPGNPLVFVVAKSGNRVIFYDGVEEGFGVGTMDGRVSLKDCGPVGELQLALTKLQGG